MEQEGITEKKSLEEEEQVVDTDDRVAAANSTSSSGIDNTDVTSPTESTGNDNSTTTTNNNEIDNLAAAAATATATTAGIVDNNTTTTTTTKSVETTTTTTTKPSDVEPINNKKNNNDTTTLGSTTTTIIDTTTTTTTIATTTIGTGVPNYTNRKVLIQNVMKFNDHRSMKKILDIWINDANKINEWTYERIKKPPKETWMVITMTDSTMVQPLIDYINNTDTVRNKKGGRIFAKIVDEHYESNNPNNNNKRKRNDDNEDNNNNGTKHAKRSSDTTNTTTVLSSSSRRPVSLEEIKDKIIPLWKIQSKQQQLDTKMKDMIKRCCMKIIHEIKQKFTILNKDKNRAKIKVYPWIVPKTAIHVNDIISAPTPLRNKSEFTFGYRYLFTNKVTGEEEKVTITTTDEATSTKADETNPTNDDNNTDGTKDEEMKTEESSSNNPTQQEQEITCVPACGFMVTGWAGGVCRPHGCDNIPTEHCTIVDIMDTFLQNQSKLPVYDSKSHKGFWRLLTVRTSRRTYECMIIIQHTPATTGGEGDIQDTKNNATSATMETDDNNNDPKEENTSTTAVSGCNFTEQFAIERQQLIDIFSKAEFPIPDSAQPMKVTSLFFQEFGGLSSPPPEHPVQHAYGKTCLTEQLGQCKFQISPGAFFQVNTEGAELLYQLAVDKVREIATNYKPVETLLFDVCCGTGTIGLTCLSQGAVGHVVGVDISEPAIKDAQRNAELNGFVDIPSSNNEETTDDAATTSTTNRTRFVAARAEHVLEREIKRALKNNKDTTSETTISTFVAIVDPAREGLHSDVIKTIRATEQIQRLVYVSCNPTGSLVNDAALLCTPPSKRYTGRPFKITSASPVDMFPLTNHCEMVMVFDRLQDNELE